MPVKHEIRDGIAEIVLDDPPLNILTQALLGELRDALAAAASEATLRVVLLRAEGKHFSAGASVEEHLPGAVEEMIPEFMATVAAVYEFPLPVIVAVHGRCLGGALEVALAGDLLVAGEGALFGVPEIKLGVLPPAACVQLPRIVGPGLAAEMVFTGEAIGAATALRAGMIDRIVPDEHVTREARDMAEGIAGLSAAALRSAKRALRAGGGRRDEAMAEASRIYLKELMSTRDAVEGLRSFTERRKPQWSHS